MLLKFISSSGVVHEVAENSIAAELMLKDENFKAIRNDTDLTPQPVAASPVTEFQITAEFIRGLIETKETKGWRALGYRSFVDYLNSDRVPFGSTKFYQLRDLLLAKGDDDFNSLMNIKAA